MLIATAALGAFLRSTSSARPTLPVSMAITQAVAAAVVAAILTIAASAEQAVDADTCKVVLFR